MIKLQIINNYNSTNDGIIGELSIDSRFLKEIKNNRETAVLEPIINAGSLEVVGFSLNINKN